MKHKINHQNIKDWVQGDHELFDGVLCDPPYELGFMGKSWDSSGIAFDVEMWRGIYDKLKPGAHLLAFSGSRTYHRMAVAIEDAGFEIRDQIIWMYGSGFPKSLNIGKAVDKVQGNEREVVGPNPANRPYNYEKGETSTGWQSPPRPDKDKGTSEWEGYGTALKPAHEPCVLARKPIDGTVANNVLKHGTGGLNIDGTRIGYGNESDNRIGTDAKAGGGQESQFGSFSNVKDKNIQMYKSDGRFPANLIHDGSDEVEAVLGDKARYFYTSKASKKERNAGLEGFEEKITNDGREKDIDNAFQRGTTLRSNHHPTVKPLSLTKYLATLIKPPTGGRLLVPFSGSGSEMIGALQAGWEYVEGVELTEEYIPIAEARIKYWLEKEKTKQEALL